MFEFEMPGNLDDLETMEKELMEYLGWCSKGGVVVKDYMQWCEDYGVEELEHEHEDRMCKEWQGRVCMIKNFPNYTSPFWNMKQNGDGTAAKIDVIIAGQETIGSAERVVILLRCERCFIQLVMGSMLIYYMVHLVRIV
jgi:aspartyl/asparaginyl-tRNA synthetase